MYSRRLDLSVGALPKSLAVADIDGDKRPDVLVARATGNGALVQISPNSSGMIAPTLLNGSIGDTGTGWWWRTLTAMARWMRRWRIFSAAMSALYGSGFATRSDWRWRAPDRPGGGDVNSDGRPDVLTANQVNNSVGVNLNLGEPDVRGAGGLCGGGGAGARAILGRPMARGPAGWISSRRCRASTSCRFCGAGRFVLRTRSSSTLAVGKVAGGDGDGGPERRWEPGPDRRQQHGQHDKRAPRPVGRHLRRCGLIRSARSQLQVAVDDLGRWPDGRGGCQRGRGDCPSCAASQGGGTLQL